LHVLDNTSIIILIADQINNLRNLDGFDYKLTTNFCYDEINYCLLVISFTTTKRKFNSTTHHNLHLMAPVNSPKACNRNHKIRGV